MYYLALYITKVLSIGALAGHLFLIGLLGLFLFKKQESAKNLLQWTQKKVVAFGLWLMFLIPFSAVLSSLFYSELAQFPPCTLCWWQRIFIYPQAIIHAIALKRKDFKVVLYTLPVTLVGLLIAVYHYIIQLQEMYGSEFLALVECTTAGGPSCSSYYFLEFGYITIPLMSVTAFFFLFLLQYFFYRRSVKAAE